MTSCEISRRDEAILTAIVFVLLPLAIHAPVWSGRFDFFSGSASDLIPYVYGLKIFQHQSIQHWGALPLWNPHLLFGQPVAGNIQNALFYPLNMLFWIFPFFTALWISQTLHMALAGYGAWLLARETGCGTAASLTTGGLFMLNGRIFYYINAGWVGYLHAICWLPLVLLTSLRLWRSRGLAQAKWLAMLLAVCLLCGTPQYAFMAFVLVSVHGAVWVIKEKQYRSFGDVVGKLVFAGAVFFVLSAVQIFPSAEQVYISSRPLSAGSPIGFHFSWDLAQWIRILVRPEFLSHDYAWELCGYIGVGGLVLALLGMGYRARQWDVLLVWGVLPALLSFGPAIPFLDRVLRSVPGLSMLVCPSRYYIFTILILTVAAGWGLQAIVDRQREKHYRDILPAAALCLILASAAWAPVGVSGEIDANWRLGASLSLTVLFLGFFIFRPWRLSLWLLVSWLLIDPLMLAPHMLQGYRAETIHPPARIMAALAADPRQIRVAVIQPERLRNNLVSVLSDHVFINTGIDRIGGYEPLAMLRSLRFLTRMDGTPPPDRTFWGFRPFAFARPELFRLAGVTHLITTEPMDSPELDLVANDIRSGPDFHGGRWNDERIYLYEIKNALPLAFMISFDGHRLSDKVTLYRTTPNRRLLRCNPSTAGTVIITESFHDGWHVWVDGVATAVRPFLDAFMAIDLPAGEHRIVLEFRPASYSTGLRTTGVGLIFIVTALAYELYMARRRRRSQRSTVK